MILTLKKYLTDELRFLEKRIFVHQPINDDKYGVEFYSGSLSGHNQVDLILEINSLRPDQSCNAEQYSNPYLDIILIRFSYRVDL